MTNYVLEDYFNWIAIFEAVKMTEYLVPNLGFYFEAEKFYIFQPELVSLFDLIHNPENTSLRENLN